MQYSIKIYFLASTGNFSGFFKKKNYSKNLRANNFCILNKNSSYILFESATIIELHIVDKFDYIISVIADFSHLLKIDEKDLIIATKIFRT